VLISVEGKGKNQLQPGQESMRETPPLSHCFLLRNSSQNQPVCWSIVAKEKPTVGSSFYRAFPTDRIPKATRDVNVHFFIYSSTSSEMLHLELGFVWCWKLDASASRSELPGRFWNVVLEKDGEDQLERSREKWRSVT